VKNSNSIKELKKKYIKLQNDENKISFKFRKIRAWKVSKNHPSYMYFATTFEIENYEKVPVLKRNIKKWKLISKVLLFFTKQICSLNIKIQNKIWLKQLKYLKNQRLNYKMELLYSLKEIK
jgi:hypothetical protein